MNIFEKLEELKNIDTWMRINNLTANVDDSGGIHITNKIYQHLFLTPTELEALIDWYQKLKETEV